MTKANIRKLLTDTCARLRDEGATETQLRSVTTDIAANDAGWRRLFPAKATIRKGVRKAGTR